MAWIEDRWHLTVKNADGSASKEQSPRYGTGKRWRVRYEDPSGAERARSFTRKPDAERFRDTVAADLLRGTYLDPDAGKMTLAAYTRHWLETQGSDPVTRITVEGRTKHILAGLGHRTLAQVAASPSAIQAWVAGLRLAPATKRECLRVLSSICTAAVEDGRMARNPCRLRTVRRPTVPQKKVQPLEGPALAKLREALPARWRAMAEAGASCGLRQGEIFGLSPADIDFLRRTVHVRRQVKLVNDQLMFALPKRGKTRDVPLLEPAPIAFARHIEGFPPAAVTLPWHEPGSRQHGKPVTVTLMFTTPYSHHAIDRHSFNRRCWKSALRAAGLEPARENGMHLLRHTYASWLIHKGVNIRRVAACLGHEDPGFTLRVYGHLIGAGEDEVRRLAGNIFENPAATGPEPDAATPPGV